MYGNSAKVQDEQNALDSQLDHQWSDPTVAPSGPAAPAPPGEDLVGRLYIPKLDKKWVVVNGVRPQDIKYAPGETTISTAVTEVLEKRVGVCQDFAHLMISCLRSRGLPARYVSGYLRTNSPDTKDGEKLVGDAA